MNETYEDMQVVPCCDKFEENCLCVQCDNCHVWLPDGQLELVESSSVPKDRVEDMLFLFPGMRNAMDLCAGCYNAWQRIFKPK